MGESRNFLSKGINRSGKQQQLIQTIWQKKTPVEHRGFIIRSWLRFFRCWV